ncbi:MAG TPA: PilZ domain-containing protein [Byssovorax sp.]|jgi:hypothetical protein
MRVRESEGGAESGGADGVERRKSAHRVHFEALVAVGGDGNGGFEAESIDVSAEGMRLRTAYVPEVGDKLVCRFDGPGVEIVADGEVAWRVEEAKGGEFGLRFTNLDEGALEAVKELVRPDEPEADASKAVAQGSRVRLHIEGLASPMKARVRESSANELEVGSNLEFLKVGRALDLEDVERGDKRVATIDHVKIDVDPATSVPQLVVSLRFEAVAASAARPQPAKSTRPAAQSTRPKPAADDAAEASDAGDEQHDDAAKPANAAAAALATIRRAGKTAGDKLGPALAFASGRAKGALASVVANVQKRREQRVDAKKTSAPRRTTAPAPGGALKSEGKRLVREDADDVELAAPAPRVNKRAAIVGSALGLVAVLAVFGVSQHLHHAKTDVPAATQAAALPPAGGLDAPMGAASGTPVAAVPLFGATPLSTTEAVPPPEPSASAVASNAPAEQPPADGADGKSALVKEWGQGKVAHAKTLKIKLDGPLDGLVGASGAQGFTLTIPNHRVLSPSTDLAHKDKRLASVKIVNTAQGAEITVQFKDGVPPYLAKVRDDKLEIALGSEPRTVAKKKTSKKKH